MEDLFLEVVEHETAPCHDEKELFEQLKTHRLVVMLLLFTLVGVLSPAFAKMTPWLLDLVSGDMAETGIQIGNLEVTSLSSWTQYYKNMQIILFVFLILYGGILTSEYQHGTLIILLSKGLKRHNILLPKYFCPASDLDIWVSDQLWHHLCLHRLLLGQQHHSEPGVLLLAFYLLGVWMISVLVGASVFCRSVSAVLLVCAACFGISYFAGFFPAVNDYVPTLLLGQMDLLTGTTDCSHFLPAIIITVLLTVFNVAAAVLCFRKTSI